MIKWQRAAFTITLWILSTAGSFASTGTVTREYFGFHAHRIATTTAWPTAPFGSWRLWDSYVTWPYLETERGKWNFQMLDKYVGLAQQHGVQLLLPLGLSPTWASSRPEESSAYSRPGWAAEPQNVEDWQTYVRTVASRYRGKIRYYEIWNEPNLTRFFSGSIEAMVALACEARNVIKSIDPAAKVVSPAATEKEKGVKWLRDFMAAGGSECIDIVGFHFYTYAHEGPETMVRFMQDVRDIAREYGKGSIWNTETGWYFANQRVPPKTKYRVQSLAEQAGYIVRAHVLGAAAGLERFFWYSWDNPTMGGLIEPDTAEPKPAVAALRSAIRWLVGAGVGPCTPDGRGVWICALTDARRGKAWIAWRPAGNIAWSIPASMQVRAFERANGESGLVAAEGVELGPLPTLLTASTAKW